MPGNDSKVRARSCNADLELVAFLPVQEVPHQGSLLPDNTPNQYFRFQHRAIGQVQPKRCAPEQLILRVRHRKISRDGQRSQIGSPHASLESRVPRHHYTLRGKQWPGGASSFDWALLSTSGRFLPSLHLGPPCPLSRRDLAASVADIVRMTGFGPVCCSLTFAQRAL